MFLDSVGLVALWNKRDQWHVAADKSFQELVQRRVPFVSTNFVLAECANALARVEARTYLKELVEGLSLSGGLEIIGAEDWQKRLG